MLLKAALHFKQVIVLTETQKIQELIHELKRVLDGEVRFDSLTRHLYSTDASDFQKIPVGVVIPKNVDDICAAVELAEKYETPIIPRGGGSSLSGQTIGTGLIIDYSRYLNRIVNLNIDEKWVNVESGVVLDFLNAQLYKHGLMVGLDPSSSAVATLGGMAGNNSTGSHSFKYGMFADHVHELEVVLADGQKAVFNEKGMDELAILSKRKGIEGHLYQKIPEILKTYQSDIQVGFPKTWRNVAGYGLNRLLDRKLKHQQLNLSSLVVGSEGTLAGITRIKLGLVSKPEKVCLMILHYNDLSSSLQDVPQILEHKPSAVELMSFPVLKAAHDHPEFRSRLEKFVDGLPGALLVVEFTGDNQSELDDQVEKLQKGLNKSGFKNTINICKTPEEVARVWNIRKATLGLLVSAPGDAKPIWVIDDASVPVEEMEAYTRDVIEMGRRYGTEINFDAHASAGCLHMGLGINLRTVEGLKGMEVLSKEIMSIAIAHHGTTTGEHGEGLARSYFNEQLYGTRLHQAFKDVKTAFDPNNQFNPKKIVDAIEPWDTDWLKYHPGYQTPYALKKTYFDYSFYGGYEKLVEMCNGQGTCRSQVSGTMCPSYRVTHDEKDTTRGRANALRVAMTGQLGKDGLANPDVHKALELCLECKACRNECSSQVDMAKLKYEFLAYYQSIHGVPLRSRLFGKMPLSSAVGSKAPRLSNAIYNNRLFREILDRVAKIDKRRQLPQLARKPFRHWFQQHLAPSGNSRGKVVLWDDCHLTYHEPELGVAAVQILETAGFEVLLAENRKCCGRPMISKGLLKEAKRHARQNVAVLEEFTNQGIPIIGVEPSCIACMRDEYPDLLQTDAARQVADHSFFFEEFITNLHQKGELDLTLVNPNAINRIKVHTHCYQKAFGTAENVIQMLRLIPDATVEEINSGCCGMAGSFGFEKEHYDISMAIGELSLFPSVRDSHVDTIIAAAGTSCRQQIKDGTGKKAVHPITVIASFLSDS
jgi:FAD/FMN-containing dehydrogenase/Fe-S oxidoreductase